MHWNPTSEINLQSFDIQTILRLLNANNLRKSLTTKQDVINLASENDGKIEKKKKTGLRFTNVSSNDKGVVAFMPKSERIMLAQDTF